MNIYIYILYDIYTWHTSHYSEKFNVHYPFEFIVVITFVLPSHCSETHFPYKKMVIAQVEATPFIVFIF